MLARGVRNVIYNYTEAQRKVRSATSNDAWGPSPALMHEIADLTDNVVAYAEIMPIIWKRLNDHGKNWRHVYKSLVLLDHLIKYGNERVSQQCKENIFAIQTLKDFQYVEEQKDQGYNVREKAKQLVALLKDDERLRNERRKAQEARERFSRQAMGMDSSGAVTYARPANSTSMRRNSAEGGDSFGTTSYPYTTNSITHRSSSFNDNLHAAAGKDFVQPANQEEEQLQMQIALAESQREAEDQERRRRNDDLKLKIALERSVNEGSPDALHTQGFDFNTNSNLFDGNHHQDPYASATTTSMGWNPPNNRPSTHLGFTTSTNDPWSSEPSGRTSANTTTKVAAMSDPWQSGTSASDTHANPWGDNNHASNNNSTGLSVNIADPWGVGTNGFHKSPTAATTTTSPPSTTSKTIDNELSEFFGASANIATNTNGQQQASSNPWNMPSTTFPPTTATSSMLNDNNNNLSGSISPPNVGLPAGGNMLYPTIAGSNSNSNSTNPSPFPPNISASRKTPESFLGENFSNLVNLDKLVTDPKSTNPFGSTAPRAPNPFANTMKPPTLDQLSSSNNVGFTTGSTLPPPLIPSSFNNTTTSSINSSNPFM
ncbi:unnamed protein product [Adineta ricciae]|uniref:ENTH domain-containing protein n=1 Tax=Adineta ricciae TaxID=249248 RepID=A0A815I3H9_ADIRI|nr:unnamed protein product [Adineta ricciae]